MANKCCPTDVKPAINDYKGVGNKETIEGLFDLYVTTGGGNSDTGAEKKNAVLLIYDVFGWTPNAEQLADHIASHLSDSLVCIPDLMRGNGWPVDNIPPTKEGKFPDGVEPADGVDVLVNWIMTHPTCKFDRNDEIQKVKEYLVEKYKVRKLGMVGICWGGKVTFIAAKQEGFVNAIATCHGSLLDKSDAEAVTVPVCMLDSREEPETYKTDVRPVLEQKPFASLNVFKDFPTMHHGWMGVRGIGSDTDFGDDEVQKRYMEGVADLVNFFTTVFAID